MGTAKRERQKANRQIRLEEMARQAQKDKRKRGFTRWGVAGVAAVVVILLLVVVTGKDKKSATSATSTTEAAAATPTSSTVPIVVTGASITGDTPCPAADGSAAKTVTFEKAPPLCIDAAKTYWIAVDGVGLARGEMDVVFDLPDLDSSLVPLCAPARVLDTRPSGQTVDGQHRAVGAIAAGTTYELPIAGRADVPADAASVVLNVTAVAPSAGGYVTVFPCGAEQPNSSNLNFAAGDSIPNSVIAGVGTAGSVCLFSSVSTQLLVDVSGYFP